MQEHVRQDPLKYAFLLPYLISWLEREFRNTGPWIDRMDGFQKTAFPLQEPS